MMTEEEYVSLATRELKWLISALDAAESDDLEAELESDIITIELPDCPDYVINSHRAARQIWMAANRAAWHFDYDRDQDRWISEKTGEELWATLNRALRQQLPDIPPLVRPSDS